ncbi:C6 zinc finger domain-containing protein [Colletotrichum lupini]|uniref:C6 zinc finger domain-containing protein n=1 Tax=Colletotrichum lupini TaxID=145971 RepID=A0A9Q8T5N0_9PEZI|nr:C6 zinc finger domain-containing protein [Colletotrichum lupini]UQC88586.1 C6 zinc finger domain-containing protein [Colletotrichum lupini]
MPRIGHKKSRNGCSNCKQRKVKCDENRPCGACVRLQIECSLTPSSIQDRSQISASTLDGHGDDSSTISSKSTPPGGASSKTPPPSLGADFPVGPVTENAYPWMMDLGLMNHFTSVTSATLPGANLHTWRDKVPAVAADSPYLMHQILAVSAFHLATMEPLGSFFTRAHMQQQQQRQEKLSLALQHQHHAIRGVQAEISHVTPANCDALFAASSLLFIGAFAASGPTPRSPFRQLEVDDILEVFTLIRGVSSVMASARENVRHCILKDFMQCNPYLGGNELLTLLQENISRIECGLDQQDVSPEIKNVISETISGFRDSIERASSITPELNVAVSWPMVLRENFMALLVVRDPASLVILAHYCTVLHAAGSQFWFMKAWGRHLLAAITRSLPPSWRNEIKWPEDYVNPRLASQNGDIPQTSVK